MAKFDKAGANKSFGEVGKKAAEKATVITIQNISTENLLDNPENGEDVTVTEDLELSMQENGFTDPLEVTDFEQEAGKYMILSGHRRRQAGLKVGFTVFRVWYGISATRARLRTICCPLMHKETVQKTRSFSPSGTDCMSSILPKADSREISVPKSQGGWDFPYSRQTAIT